jgi:hypothetical protein
MLQTVMHLPGPQKGHGEYIQKYDRKTTKIGSTLAHVTPLAVDNRSGTVSGTLRANEDLSLRHQGISGQHSTEIGAKGHKSSARNNALNPIDYLT